MAKKESNYKEMYNMGQKLISMAEAGGYSPDEEDEEMDEEVEGEGEEEEKAEHSKPSKKSKKKGLNLALGFLD